MLGPFKNEPFLDFSRPENKTRMEQALAVVEAAAGQEYPCFVGGREVAGSRFFSSVNPSEPRTVLARFPEADPFLVKQAVEAAQGAFAIWKKVPALARAKILFKAGEIIRRRRFELLATLVIEIGKSWSEADGEVAECVDFCEYYGRAILALDSPPPLTPWPGELNELRYIPLGVGVVIPPWNYPMAILHGMSAAAMVTGNTVVVKPSPDAPLSGFKIVDVMREAGLPDGVMNFVTGGADVGRAMVLDPRTRFIAFTGSRKVGLEINEIAARPQPGQIWIKRVIAEMGGKDAIVVDRDVDLDAVAQGVLAAAFGYAGQKCSACSRLIVDRRVKVDLLERIVEGARKLEVGNPKSYGTDYGPVINQAARDRILSYIHHGKSTAALVSGGEPAKGEGYFLEPTIFDRVDPRDRLAQEEIFGPLLAVIEAEDFRDALRIANDTEFGLTGAAYTRSREQLELAREEFHVGNLYLNRKCTGALVGVHPFGGFNMSGTDSKGGGPDYLLLYTQGKVIAEKL